MKSYSVLLAFTLLIFFAPFESQNLLAQAPKTISYQGFLTDQNRDVVGDDNYNVTFRIYDQAGGGTALWTENKTVEVSSGVFTAILGQLVPLISQRDNRIISSNCFNSFSLQLVCFKYC